MTLHFNQPVVAATEASLNEAFNATLIAAAGDSNDGELEALNNLVSELMAYAEIRDDGTTQVAHCDSCGEPTVEPLSSRDLCPTCDAEDGRVECPNCGEYVKPSEMNHWPKLAEPVSMCDSCEHNARRSGWEPGQ